MNKFLLSLFLFLLPVYLLAGGFQINLQGSSQPGMASVGTALANDNATLYYNPGGLVWNKSAGLSINSCGVFARTKFQSASPSVDEAQTQNPIGTPFSIFLINRCHSCGDSSKWAAGIGIYTPYGSHIKWHNDWLGRYVIQEISLQTIFIQPTVSIRLNKIMSVGVGGIIAYSNLQINKAIPLTSSTSDFASVNLKGKANSVGFVMGLYYHLTEKWRAGATLRTPIGMAVTNGKAVFTNIPSALRDSFPNGNFKTTFFLPGTLSIGTAFQPIGNLTLAFDLCATYWHNYDSVNVDFIKNTSLLTDSHSPKKYKNSLSYRLGASYNWNKFIYRAGIVYDKSPIENNYAGPDVPDADKVELTAGLGLKIKNINWNLFAVYANTVKRDFTNIETNLSGSYQTKALIIGSGIGLNF